MERIVVLDECGSTNIEAADKDVYGHGDAVIAITQTAGRGQRGHKWESVPGENLTFSLVLTPSFLPAAKQFLLSEAVALAITDTLDAYGIKACIKWTNDIYVGDRKICGTLIENDLRNGYVSRSIVGIGLNVNQHKFPDWIPNPDSMFLETAVKYDIFEVFSRLYEDLMRRYDALAEGNEIMEEEYNSKLYRLAVPNKFFIPSEGEVVGTICGVESTGALRVMIDNVERSFLFKEIEFRI